MIAITVDFIWNTLQQRVNDLEWPSQTKQFYTIWTLYIYIYTKKQHIHLTWFVISDHLPIVIAIVQQVVKLLIFDSSISLMILSSKSWSKLVNKNLGNIGLANWIMKTTLTLFHLIKKCTMSATSKFISTMGYSSRTFFYSCIHSQYFKRVFD